VKVDTVMKIQQRTSKSFTKCLIQVFVTTSLLSISQIISAQEVPYFSGTNAETGLIWLWPTNPDDQLRFTNFKLKVSGRTKYGAEATEVWNESLNAKRITWTLNLNSNRFVNGSTIAVESQVQDNLGRTYSRKVTGTVKNKAIVLAHRDNTTFVDPIYAKRTVRKLKSMGNSVLELTATPVGFPTNGTENKEYVLSPLPNYNIMHVGSHGNPDAFEAPGYGGVTNPAGGTGYIRYQFIHDAVGKKTKDNPPYNFVFFTSCNAMGTLGSNGLSTKLAESFGINDNRTNAASIGFRSFMFGFHHWTSRVYDNLKEGFVLSDAINIANSMGKPTSIPTVQHDLTIIPSIINRFEVEPVIVGDKRMTLNKLYKFPRGKVDWAHVETIKE
jgi:hypothetical protein